VDEGEWVDYKKHGKGKLTWANGDVYEGERVDDRKHGKGKYTNADGTIYHDGEWENDKPKK
jgi:hypothetical protein